MKIAISETASFVHQAWLQVGATAPVRETITANALIRYQEATPEDREKILEAIQQLIGISRDDFADMLAEDRDQIAEPTRDVEKVDALYRSGSRMAKVQRLVVEGSVKVTIGLTTGFALGQVIAVILRLLGL